MSNLFVRSKWSHRGLLTLISNSSRTYSAWNSTSILDPLDYKDSPMQTDSNGKIKWSVLPPLSQRQRSPATIRLWLSKYIAQKQKTSSQFSSFHDLPNSQTIQTSSPSSNSIVSLDSSIRKLITKKMSDSYVEEFLPFKSNPLIREEYINFYGGVRVSKILEDLDALAGSIAYCHCDDGNPSSPPLTIVTASVDRIDLLGELSITTDYILSGHVTHVGISSMEISISMVAGEEIDEKLFKSKNENPILIARFNMVAKDSVTNLSAKVNQLSLETDSERKLFDQGWKQKNSKKEAMEKSLMKLPPTLNESREIHGLYLEYASYNALEKPDNVVWMADTTMESNYLCSPQDRNIHGFVFGGYLMKVGFEIAYNSAMMFTKSRPNFAALDDIIFRKAVPIGSILNLSSTIVYSSGSPSKSFQIKVVAVVIEPLTGKREVTNVFHFTFWTPNSDLKRILPKTYHESMMFLSGKRRRDTAIQILKEREASNKIE